MPSYWIAPSIDAITAAATQLATEKHAAAVEAATGAGEEPPEAPAAFEEPLAAATAVLEDEGIKGCVAGADAPADFTAVCEKLGIVTHPAILKGFTATALVVKGWKCDLPSLCAMLVVLQAHGKFKTLKFWGCGLDAAALALLASAAPASVEVLAFEGEALPVVEALPSVASLSLRCAALTAAPAPLLATLPTNTTLTTLSLFGNALGDEGAASLLAALRGNTSVTTLDLTRTGLSDEVTDAVLAMVTEDPAVAEAAAAADAAEPPAEESAEAPAAEPPVPPNATLTSLSVAFNNITTEGRLTLEAAQQAAPSLAKLDLTGNPCLTSGPTAAMPVAARAAIAASWAALAELEGGAEAAMTKIVASALDGVPEMLPIVGYAPPVPPEPEEPEEGADPKAEEPPLEGLEAIEAWSGLGPLAALVSAAIGSLVAGLGRPEMLGETLRHEYGTLIASRDVPPGAPFDKFGELLIGGLGSALGDAFPEEAKSAWTQAYAEASACMQQAFSPSQLAAAAAAIAAAAAAAEAEAPEE